MSLDIPLGTETAGYTVVIDGHTYRPLLVDSEGSLITTVAAHGSTHDPTGSDPLSDESIISRKLAPTIVEKGCTTNITINSTADTDITGATITLTPAIASMAIVWATFDIELASGAGGVGVFVGLLDVDGTNQPAQIPWNPDANNERGTASQHWVFPLTVAAHTIKLQGKLSEGTKSFYVYTPHTKLTILLIGDANVTEDTTT